jgi:hypothetical protein
MKFGEKITLSQMCQLQPNGTFSKIYDIVLKQQIA